MHTTPPAELVLPQKPDLMTMRADFNGHCIDLSRWGLKIEYQGENWKHGANSTPLNMIMTPMLAMYDKRVQDAVLTEHSEMYTHFVVAPDGWNMPENDFAFTPTSYVAWCRYVKRFVPYVVHWQGNPDANHPLLRAALDADVIDWIIYGKEVESIRTMEAYYEDLDRLRAITSKPTCAHFSANWPDGFPNDTMVPDWGKYDGWLHLAWQAGAHGNGQTRDPKTDSAGKMGALLYYARERVNLGLHSGVSAAPNSRVYLFEIMPSDQLYGQCDELHGKLRTLELMWCPRRDVRVLPLAGYASGGSLPDGWFL